MILSIARGTIKVFQAEKTATVLGEMFFLPNEKLGFQVYLESLKHWDPPYEDITLTPDDLVYIIDDIRREFEEGGHTVVVE